MPRYVIAALVLIALSIIWVFLYVVSGRKDSERAPELLVISNVFICGAIIVTALGEL